MPAPSKGLVTLHQGVGGGLKTWAPLNQRLPPSCHSLSTYILTPRFVVDRCLPPQPATTTERPPPTTNPPILPSPGRPTATDPYAPSPPLPEQPTAPSPAAKSAATPPATPEIVPYPVLGPSHNHLYLPHRRLGTHNMLPSSFPAYVLVMCTENRM